MSDKKSKDKVCASGISSAALEGARSTNQPSSPPRDAKTVNPDRVEGEQPSKLKQPTQVPRAIELPNMQEDQEQLWRRAGGKDKGTHH